MEKNDAQVSGFAVVKKAPSPWKKNIWKENFFQLLCTDKIYKTVGGNFLKINGSRDKLSLIFRFQKIVLHHKINKTPSTKNQGNYKITKSQTIS